jgi:hypothetical protein
MPRSGDARSGNDALSDDELIAWTEQLLTALFPEPTPEPTPEVPAAGGAHESAPAASA